ncbi:hypothetical protein D9M69_641590 [compost metagenome]
MKYLVLVVHFITHSHTYIKFRYLVRIGLGLNLNVSLVSASGCFYTVPETFIVIRVFVPDVTIEVRNQDNLSVKIQRLYFIIDLGYCVVANAAKPLAADLKLFTIFSFKGDIF